MKTKKYAKLLVKAQLATTRKQALKVLKKADKYKSAGPANSGS